MHSFIESFFIYPFIHLFIFIHSSFIYSFIHFTHSSIRSIPSSPSPSHSPPLTFPTSFPPRSYSSSSSCQFPIPPSSCYPGPAYTHPYIHTYLSFNFCITINLSAPLTRSSASPASPAVPAFPGRIWLGFPPATLLRAPMYIRMYVPTYVPMYVCIYVSIYLSIFPWMYTTFHLFFCAPCFFIPRGWLLRLCMHAALARTYRHYLARSPNERE